MLRTLDELLQYHEQIFIYTVDFFGQVSWQIYLGLTQCSQLTIIHF